MAQPIFCFIDDSPFERALFLEVFPRHAPHLRFITAHTFGECEAMLRHDGVEPALFILDLYGPTGATASPVPEQAELARQTQGFVTLDEVYRNLEQYRAELQVNEFLKRLFAIVEQWRHLFREHAAALDQSRQYGVANLNVAKARYPQTPAVMYTRKGIFPDAVALWHLACDGLFMKPPGRTDADIRIRTHAEAATLLAAWERIARQ